MLCGVAGWLRIGGGDGGVLEGSLVVCLGVYGGDEALVVCGCDGVVVKGWLVVCGGVYGGDEVVVDS